MDQQSIRPQPLKLWDSLHVDVCSLEGDYIHFSVLHLRRINRMQWIWICLVRKFSCFQSLALACALSLSLPLSLCPQMAFSLLSYNRKQSRVESAFTVRDRRKHQINAPFKCVYCMYVWVHLNYALCFSVYLSVIFYNELSWAGWNLPTVFTFSFAVWFCVMDWNMVKCCKLI